MPRPAVEQVEEAYVREQRLRTEYRDALSKIARWADSIVREIKDLRTPEEVAEALRSQERPR